ncbi:MAG: enoyl-CoA hydratase-related protein [Pseudomonadota bacterium]
MALQLTHDEEFAVITLNRPESLNALNFETLAEIGAAIDAVAASPARALIFTGTGPKAFCAGADIKELQGRALHAERRGAEFGQAVFARLDRLPIISIALVNGYAFGGGLELALACTFRLAAGNAKFGLPEVKLGLIPGYGGTQRLPRLVGESRALDMVLSGRTVDASDALAMGLVNRCIAGADLTHAKAFAREFTGHGLVALQLAREAVQRALSTSLPDGLRIEADLSTLSFRTEDAQEGLQAFVDKRKPVFKDR